MPRILAHAACHVWRVPHAHGTHVLPAEEERLLSPPLSYGSDGLDQIMRDGLGDERVVLVVRVAHHEGTHPRGRGEQLARRTPLDELHVGLDEGERLWVTLDLLEVGEDQRDQPGEGARLAVDDLGGGHLLYRRRA